jgi:hypothetical protein
MVEDLITQKDKLSSELKEIKKQLKAQKTAERNKLYYAENKAKAKAYREANLEKIQENERKRHQKNKEANNLRSRTYNANNKDKVSENKKSYYERNRETILAKAKAKKIEKAAEKAKAKEEEAKAKSNEEKEDFDAVSMYPSVEDSQTS